MTVAHRILLHVALGVAFVVVVVTAMTYALVYDALKQSSLKQLGTYVTERADYEEARFQQIQSNLALVRGMFLKRLDEPMSPERVEERFNYWYRHYDDGAWRSREEFGDARKTSSMWADRDWPATLEMRRQIVIAQELCDEMLPGWVDTFPSYYFQFPAPGLANVGVDVLLADWSWKMPAHFDTTGLEWIAMALPQGVPPDAFSWTGLQSDDVVSEPLVSVYLPVLKDGVFIASVGHNMPMWRLLDAATHSEIPGASHFIFRTDGRLIADPARRSEILASEGLLKAQDSGDTTLASLYRIASAHAERQLSGFDPVSDTYYSIARLAGPEWIYVTTMSREYLRKQAFASAQWVLWSGLISLALVLGSITAILRRQIARPLAELTRATKVMGAGVDEVPLPTQREDELGVLAGSFREMVTRVAERESDLRQLNLSLEKRVADRTEDLNQALARERELVQLKSNFVSLVSHEFRTPLEIITSSTFNLERYQARLSPEQRNELLDSIQRAVHRMAGMMEQVLLLGRLELDSVAFQPAPLDIAAFCRELRDEIESATQHRCPIELAVNASTEHAMANESVLRHLFMNLLSNAVKYSPTGAPVRFAVAREGADAVFTITDHGCGIPEADLPHLYEAFRRGGNVNHTRGTGLGLVIVRRCLEVHNGRISCQSREGSGTVFTVYLPLFARHAT
jgi:signal transduction histidine kinase